MLHFQDKILQRVCEDEVCSLAYIGCSTTRQHCLSDCTVTSREGRLIREMPGHHCNPSVVLQCDGVQGASWLAEHHLRGSGTNARDAEYLYGGHLPTANSWRSSPFPAHKLHALKDESLVWFVRPIATTRKKWYTACVVILVKFHLWDIQHERCNEEDAVIVTMSMWSAAVHEIQIRWYLLEIYVVMQVDSTCWDI